MNLSDTIGILIEKHRELGICKNLEPIEGITNCVGTCPSKTYFDEGKTNKFKIFTEQITFINKFHILFFSNNIENFYLIYLYVYYYRDMDSV